MSILIVVNNPNNWPLEIPNVELVSARSYLLDRRYSELRGAKIFNLCRSYRYQSIGYYVSLLAAARGQIHLPSVTTIMEMKSPAIVRFVSGELHELIQKSLAPIQSPEFTLSIYFGRNLAQRYNRLSLQLFNLFQAPLLRAHFVNNGGSWYLQQISPVAASDIPGDHRPFVVEVASQYFTGRRISAPKRAVTRYDLAILHDPREKEPPSDEVALQRFVRAAESMDLGVDLITKDDYSHLAEFDALFIRETTSINHHTYRFALRAKREGLVVVDDPESIIKCSNKVYLAELMERCHIPTPRTLIVHRENVDSIVPELGLPCVLKQPDSAFSEGVVKVETVQQLREEAERLLEKSELVVAQAYLPTTFDWRVGIFDGKPLFVCKYYMAGKHWQIVKRSAAGLSRYGRVETLPVEEAPASVVRMATRAAQAIGEGLYGVDVKQSARRCYLIEVNDNPNINAGVEDAVLKDGLYACIISTLVRRLERRREGAMKA